MSMISVSSAAIAAVGYEDGTLAVEFHDRGLYYHHGVPYSVYVELMNAPSLGAYYSRNIRGRYR
jgi:hypothetical protein